MTLSWAELTAPDLVRELSWLSVAPVVTLTRLARAESRERAAGDPVARETGHQGGNQRVAPEGVEPGRTGRDVRRLTVLRARARKGRRSLPKSA